MSDKTKASICGKKNWTFTWKNGRQLATAEITGSGNVITNTYDVDGIRETKTVGGVTHTYTTLDGKVVREAYGNVTVDYLYDNNGRPYKLIVTEGTTKYTGFYILSLQGDVIGIVDTDGTKAVTYGYSAWGTLIENSTSGTKGSKLNQYNALKYRGYYYDADLAMYYLGSRFYDTEICRFINADDLDYLGASGDFIGYNLYAYCANNPVNFKDDEGNSAILATVGIIAAGGVVGALLGALSTAASGGNIMEGAIKGAITGVIGSSCGLSSVSLLTAVAVATLGGSGADLGVQLAMQYAKNNGVDFSKIDRGSVVKTGIMTGLGTAIPVFGKGAKNAIDAFGTALIWAEGATLITCADVVYTNVKSVGVSSTKNQSGHNRAPRITKTMTTADYFSQRYNTL